MIRIEPFFHVCRSGFRVTPSFSVYPFLFFPARVLSRPCLLRIHFFSPLHPFMTHALPVSGPGCRLPPLRNEKSRPAVCRSGSFSHGRSYGGMGYLSFSAYLSSPPHLASRNPLFANTFLVTVLSQFLFRSSLLWPLFCAPPLLRSFFCSFPFVADLFCGSPFCDPLSRPLCGSPLLRPLFRGPLRGPLRGPPGKAIFGTGRG